MIEKTLVVVAVLLFVGFMVCGCIQDAMIPTWIEQSTIDCVGGYKPANGLYTSLFDLKRIQQMVDNKSELRHQELIDCIDLNKIQHRHHVNYLEFHRANAEEIKSTVFDPTNGVGLLLAGAPAFALGWLGISKPSDKKKLNGGSK
jgi:hypothetical protein